MLEKNSIKESSHINYEKAIEEYRDRFMNLSKSLHSWKIAFFCCLGIVFLSLAGTIYLSTRGSLIPYVIEVDETGNAKAINPAYQKNYIPEEEIIIYSLKEFVKNSRWISLDGVLQNVIYTNAMNFLTDSMQEKMRSISLEEDLNKLMEDKYSRDVQILSAIKVAGTKDTYQIKWIETLYGSEGEILIKSTLVGIYTIFLTNPKTLEELNRNPLGIFIKDFHISKENI